MIVKRKTTKTVKTDPKTGEKKHEFREHMKVEAKKLGKDYVSLMKDSFSGLIEK